MVLLPASCGSGNVPASCYQLARRKAALATTRWQTCLDSRMRLHRPSATPGGSSYDQKADLERQHAALEAYCAARGWRSETIKDLGSGMNYSKKGLQRLLEMILRRQMKRPVLTHKDDSCALARSWCSPCASYKASRSSSSTRESSPALKRSWPRTSWRSSPCSARLHGARSHKSKKLIDALADDKTVQRANDQLSFL